MRKKVQERKLHSRKGFTLAETLLAVLILLLVSAIVVSGIPSARDAYEKVVLSANADMLLSTTVTTLRNELGTAQDVEASGTTIAYYSPDRGASSKIFVNAKANDADSSPRPIQFQRYYSRDGLGAQNDPEQLISPSRATGDLYVTYDNVEYRDGVITITGLSVNRTSGSTGLSSLSTLSIRVISAS